MKNMTVFMCVDVVVVIWNLEIIGCLIIHVDLYNNLLLIALAVEDTLCAECVD